MSSHSSLLLENFFLLHISCVLSYSRITLFYAAGLAVFVGFSPFICIFIDFGGDVSTAADKQTKLFRYWLIQEQLGLVSKL